MGLLYNEFLRGVSDADEIHSLRQIGHIYLLGFSGEAAREDGLTHEVGDAEF